MSKKITGNDALNQVYKTISIELRKTSEGRELLNNDSHIEQRLAYFICRDLGLICKNVESGFGEDWMLGCNDAPRGRGLCLYHYQRKYMKYVFDDKEPQKKVQKYIFEDNSGKNKNKRKRKKR